MQVARSVIVCPKPREHCKNKSHGSK
jgi:hypothetical protein